MGESNSNLDLASEAEHLRARYQHNCRGPFPYEDVRIAVKKAGTSYDGLIPSLDLYFATIAGYCSWGKRMLNWDSEKRKAAIAYASRSFFDRHPEYRSLRQFIVQSDLSNRLRNIEEMRSTLLHVLSSLEGGRPDT